MRGRIVRPSPALRGGGAEHLLDIFATLPGNEIDLRLGHGDKEKHVAAQQLHRTVDDLGPHGCLSEIGNPENQRATWLQPAHQSGRPQMVCFT